MVAEKAAVRVGETTAMSKETLLCAIDQLLISLPPIEFLDAP